MAPNHRTIVAAVMFTAGAAFAIWMASGGGAAGPFLAASGGGIAGLLIVSST